jgi:hypothetical protein
MNRDVKRIAWGVFPALLLLASCTHVSTDVDHSVNFRKLDHIFVEHRLSDGRGMDQLIADELQKLGYDASAGPLTMMPDNTEAIIAYQDEWNFDFTTYLLELDIAVRDAHTGQQMAVSRINEPSIFGNNPVKMVDAALSIFKKK